jgi:hypothetical protein
MALVDRPPRNQVDDGKSSTKRIAEASLDS